MWTVLIFKGLSLSCGQSEIVVLAFSVFKRTIFIILARNQDPPWDNGAKHNDFWVPSLLHSCTFTQTFSPPQPSLQLRTHTELNPASWHLIRLFFHVVWNHVICSHKSKLRKSFAGTQHWGHVWNTTQQFQAKVSKLSYVTLYNHQYTHSEFIARPLFRISSL